MSGNWLQDLLNWYWITPWQLDLMLGVIAAVGVVGVLLIGRNR